MFSRGVRGIKPCTLKYRGIKPCNNFTFVESNLVLFRLKYRSEFATWNQTLQRIAEKRPFVESDLDRFSVHGIRP